MVVNRIKKNSILLFCLFIMGLTIFPFMGCGGGGGGSSSNPSTPATSAPRINVSKTQIVFGDVVLDKYSEETISIQNTGSSNLNIGQIAQANSLSGPFSIVNDNCSGKQLTPSQTCNFQVRFAPVIQGPFTDSFDIPSNDPNQNPVTVNVNGYGRALKVSINQVYTDSCPKVGLLISVTDKDSNPISGLLEGNLALFENGVLKDITNFHHATSAVSVALVADYSGSMKEANVIPGMEEASKLFIDQLNPGIDEAAVIKFATEIELKQDSTTDTAALKAAMDAPYLGSDTWTHLYNALWDAVDVTAARSNNHVIVVFSDGVNEIAAGSPTKTLTEVIAYAKENGVNIFTIGFGNVNEAVMNQLANETGGEYFFAPTAAELNEIYLKIAAILAGRYVIEYNSSSSGGGTVLLDLEVRYNGLEGNISQAFTGCP